MAPLHVVVGVEPTLVELTTLSISDLAPLIERRQITARELADACLERIAAANPSLNAFITVLGDQARSEARARDQEIAKGVSCGPLHGIPISIKDLIDLEGAPTTAASHVRAGHRAGADAPVVARLRRAGAIVVGKCNLHEFAFGTTSDESAFGPVRHPLDAMRSPGGSSGGSAAAVASGMCVASIGTDTGGSIRIPAAACGVVGLKPGFGELPCEGVVPLSRTLDHVGPIARSVADAWLLYDVMRGESPRAARAERLPRPGTLRLGTLRLYFFDLLDRDVRVRADEAIERLRAAGVHIEDVAIPHARLIAPVYLQIVLAEASAYHASTLQTMPEKYTSGVRLRLELGRYVLAEDYLRAQEGRSVLAREVDAALERRDALILPALAIPAPAIGATSVTLDGSTESVRNVMLRLTQLFNLTGHPAVSVPCGQTSAGLPCGIQLVGRRNGTPDLLRIARTCEPYLGPGGEASGGTGCTSGGGTGGMSGGGTGLMSGGG